MKTKDVSGCTISTGDCYVSEDSCIDLTTPLVKYLKSIPLYPQNGTDGKTQYSIITDANGLVTVRACGTEGAINISASR